MKHAVIRLSIFILLIPVLTRYCNGQNASAPQLQGQPNTIEFAPYPLQVPVQHSLLARWERKKVLASKMIDDMERSGKMKGKQKGRWSVTGIGTMHFTTAHAKDGHQSLLFTTSIRDTAYLSLPGNHNRLHSQTFNITGQAGASSIELKFEQPMDWSQYNRISFWVYVYPSTMPRHNINLAFHNQGSESNALTTAYTHYANNLIPGQWNHVLFEMPHLARNKVTMFSLTRELTGNNPGENPIVRYAIDELELQKVQTDPYEGWAVAPGLFSYNQMGYRPKDTKVAWLGSAASTSFSLINQAGEKVFSGPVKTLHNKNGTFYQLDFSSFERQGVYRMQCGGLLSNPFSIRQQIWLDPVFKAVNFYFCQRCGFDVPGYHQACHMDWQGFRGDEKKVINGGWHDAGDLSQGIWRSAMATFAMMDNLAVLQSQNNVGEVVKRLTSEIAWGMQYLLKTRFGDGYHIHWCRMRMFTDNQIGTMDDVLVPAENITWENFLAAAVESKFALLLKHTYPDLAKRAQAAALDDYQAAYRSKTVWQDASIEEASWGVTSSLLLARLTGEKKYADQGFALADLIIKCQQQNFVEDIPITGYFYTNTSRESVIHNKHTAFEEAPMIALSMLCDQFPQHENWMRWYSAVALYSQFFLERGSKIAAPYNLLPNSVWSKQEIMADKHPKRLKTDLQQYEDGTQLNNHYALRTFPIWSDAIFHGSTNVQLSSTWALAEAAKLRQDENAMQLVGQQLAWVLGANPFCQSLMYGEGYNFAPQYAYCLKNEVGSLPVGMDSRSADAPYWPATNSATFKEMWMEPVSRFLGAVAVYAAANPAAWISKAKESKLQVRLSTTQPVAGEATVKLRLTGQGKHDIAIRCFNAQTDFIHKQVELSGSTPVTIALKVSIRDQNKPYVGVLTFDHDPNNRKEFIGACISGKSLLAAK